ncbi:cytochrome b561 [Novosphingobium endophyticum]|uniref:Cytochrome b561 n=1 Tax=Novosphingobium endophyticum TaxID=1955250 RepID=A0A916X3N4_9SPHN|nr:cytochrome b/b6 domain-containing protein [Novosphingobium endophyticum]GGB94625.1 cytochrome b561 [Novosphingobium endophyticum]
MTKIDASQRYSATAVVLHWAIAALVLTVLGLGLYGSDLENRTGERLINLHKVLGLSVLTLTAVRIGWRLTHRPPALPDGMGAPMRWAAHGAHALFYILLLALPLSGWLMTSAFPQRHAIMAGPLQIPFLPVAPDMAVAGAAFFAHETGSWAMMALVALHVAAAVWHQFIVKDGLIRRMTPSPRNSART